MNIEVIDYSEKAIAVFGAVSESEATMIAAKGLFNPSLKSGNGDERKPGWIFSKKHREGAEKIAAEKGWNVVDYSEKSIAVFPTELEAHTKTLVEQKGMFNGALKYNDERKAGWIFSKKKKDAVMAALQALAKPALAEEVVEVEAEEVKAA